MRRPNAAARARPAGADGASGAQSPASAATDRVGPASSTHSLVGPVGSAHSFVVPDGRILLTPTRTHDPGSSYGEVTTPRYDLRAASSRGLKRDHSVRLADGSANYSHGTRVTGATLASRTSESGKRKNSKKLSRRALAALRMAAEVLFALCLLVAVGARASLVSLVYLFVFCYGVVRSFESRALTLGTLGVAFVACVMHGVVLALYGDDTDYSGADIAQLFGFAPMVTTGDYLRAFGVDVLVLVCSSIHFWYVLRRLGATSKAQEEEELAQQHFDLFEMGENLMLGSNPHRNRKRHLLQAVELLSAVFLMLTAVSVPAFATGAYYLVLLQRLVSYTFFTDKVTVKELVSRKAQTASTSYFLGPAATTVVLVLSLVVITLWYVFQLAQVNSIESVATVGDYLGFVDFRADEVDWQYYFFGIFQLLLFFCCAKLYNLHVEAKVTGELHGEISSRSSQISQPDGTVDLGVVNADVAQSLLDPLNQPQETRSIDIQDLLSKQSFVVRAFVRDGGLLIGSSAAIVWCVSYPSYVSAPFLGLSFVTIALFGLSSPSIFIWVLLAYGTGLGLLEYVSNLTLQFIPEDYTQYGMRAFEYPFLDLGAHTLCLVFMFVAFRTQWRYQDILRESRQQKQLNAATRPVAMPSEAGADGAAEDDNGVEYSNFQELAKMRKELQLGWQAVARLWFVDAKRVIFTHLDALVLITILVVAISTNVSFLQIGYLVLAALLMLFFDHRRRFWRILLLYALAACFAVFVRNVECTKSSTMELIGLQCYNPNSHTWGSLWPTLFSAQLLIIFQLVFQLVIYVANNDTIEERLRTRGQVRQNPMYFISRLGVEVDNWFRICGVVICYIAFIVIAVQFETGVTRLSTTVIGGVQLTLCMILLGTHLGNFPTAPRTSLRLKVLWSLTLVIEVLILVARYVYQFRQVSTYMEEHFFTSGFITAEDFGLEYHASSDGISDVFLYLLPTAIMMALCFWQLSSMMKEVQPYDIFTAGRSKAVDWIRFGMETVQHVLISFSATAIVIVTMWVALNTIDFVGWLYVLVLIVGRPMSDSWKHLWFPLFWISALSLVLKYLIQLSTFDTQDADADGDNVLFKAGDDSDWLGMIRVYERYDVSVGKSELWDLLSGEFVILLMCAFQRMAQYFDATSSARRQAELDELTARFEEDYAIYAANNLDAYHPTSSCEVDDDDDDLKDRAGAFANDAEDRMSARSKDTPASPESERVRKRSGQSSSAANADHDKDFFSCLRAFGTTYASKASVNVVMLLLTLSCFVHQDIIAVIYMLIVYAMMYAASSTVCKRWWAVALLLSLVIVLEYSVMLWLPPFLDVEMEDYFPWRVVSDSYQKWFVLNNQDKWALMVDFVALLSVYLLPDSNKFSENEVAIKVVDDDVTNSTYGVMDDADQVPGSTRETTHFAVLSDEYDYVLLTRQYLWFYLEYAFLANWLPLLLLLVFVFGAIQGGIVSIAYLLGALIMLYRLDEARAPSNPWIRYLRKWNWAHLFVIVIINAPYVNSALSDCLIGDSTSDDDSCMSVANFLGVEADSIPYNLIALFVLISIQCEILNAPTYRTVYAVLLSEQNRSATRRDEIVRDFYTRRTAQWFAMKKDKNAAIQRLKVIVSKLVHKVEELMDIAMGLHYNLPPMAPTKPMVVECTQNSATISWEKPTGSHHKIRYYRISRQQFPSLTLLGDFADIVEIKGDHCEAKIEGLRPGTSYQFKVCAVSRMGEGPFSIASDPIATYPLNLDGSTTAGWMKYRRERLPVSRLAFLISWLKAKYLHRYVVIDSSHLVFYQNEEKALKHRSRKRRKRLKTSFKWREVISIRLSDEKVQFDDMSPMLYCFEIVARHAGDRGDVKYIFQAELTKDFNKFLSALAFAVPRDALDDSIIECLKDRNLPNPLDVAPASGSGEDDPNYDESKSEWSSVTGDESTLGDPEDEEFDETTSFAWRTPVYNFLYKLQNAAFRMESPQYEEDDLNEPTVMEIVQLIINGIRSKSAGLCCLGLIICFTVQADFLNMMYALAAFGFLILENPRPSPMAWTYLLAYTCCVIALRYLFQLSIFCTGMTAAGYYYPSVEPYCTTAASAATNAKSIQPIVLFGLYKFDGLALDNVTSVYDGLQWDFYVMILLLWHQRELRLQGFWAEAEGENGFQDGSSRFKSEAMRDFRSSFSSSHDSIDDALLYETPLTGKKLGAGSLSRASSRSRLQAQSADPLMSSQRSSRRNLFPRSTMNPSVLSVETSEIANEVAAQALEELQAQEEQEERNKFREAEAAEAAAEARGDNVALSPSQRRTIDYDTADTESPSSGSPRAGAVGSEDKVISEQIEIDDESEVGFHARAKESWLKKTFPPVYNYFQTVICDPPAQWDKDIHVAITGEKPGRDFYTASLTMLLISAIFAVILYEEIGETSSSDTSVADAASRVSSSSLLSGYLVLMVLVQLIFIIWDRVAYVCGSLLSKVVLQYSYAVLLHLTVWYLLPSHTNVYFQRRPALVIFYLFQCVFLWLGALQIRYGYPAYHGSRYNYEVETHITSMSERLFELMMKAPFLFEMRALLDYLCTKTSLTWKHWVLLEDTAAHLFGVKIEMRDRVDPERAEILQGKKRQPLMKKFMSAGVMLLFLLICLVGPLAMFSSINPSTTANEVTLSTVVFGIEDSQGTMNQLYSNTDGSSPDCTIDMNTDSASVQCVQFDVFSYDVWSLSPPRMDQLVEQLQSTDELNWTIEFTFDRPGPDDNEEISISFSVVMTDTQRNSMIPMIKQTLDDDAGITLDAIEIDDLYPAVLQLTASDGVLQRSTAMRSVGVAKHTSDGSTWWTIEPISDDLDYCSSDYPFCVVAVSDRIVQGLTTLGVSSYGLTAVYIFVVVTVGNAVKSFFRGKLFEIQYAELPDPVDVLELVEGIYIARQENYVGHLKDEVRIFETLVRVLRSPETLIKVTGTNVIHIPAAKEKQD